MSDVAIAMRERPILFSGSMVRALNDGRKTVTRRVVTRRMRDEGELITVRPFMNYTAGLIEQEFGCPYGQPGDRLWVRETWASPERARVAYRADGWCGARLDDGVTIHHGYIIEVEGERGPSWGLAAFGGRWRPSIHMPRWASRFTLEVVTVRVERLHEITDADAVLEGIRRPEDITNEEADVWPGAERALYNGMNQPRDVFRRLWDSLNSDRAPWASNPWVWRVEFRKLSAGELAAA